MKKNRIAILGSTGSVGTQTLDVVRENPEFFAIKALAADTNVDLLCKQIIEFMPEFVRVRDIEIAEKLKTLLADISLERNFNSSKLKILTGEDGLLEIVNSDNIDTVMVSIVGSAAFPSLVSAIKAGKAIALANKESLIIGGAVLRGLLDSSSIPFIPVDSEHNSIFQCLRARPEEEPTRVLITASGGPFLNYSLEQLSRVTPEEAVKHPKWNMGAKISVDSATLMNKGLEVIEALELFSFPLEQMDVVVHPQHLIHAIVEYSDGSACALMYDPDMRVPITHALFTCLNCSEDVEELIFPKRRRMLDFKQVSRLDFFEPDETKFPCLRLAKEAYKIGGDAKLILNWANEVAVDKFLQHKIKFMQIPEIIEKALESSNSSQKMGSLSDIRVAQDKAKNLMANIIEAY